MNHGSLSSLSTSGDHFNEAAIPAVNLWHFDLLLLHPGSLLQAAHPCSQEPSYTGALGILQYAGLLRPLLWDTQLTLTVQGTT